MAPVRPRMDGSARPPDIALHPFRDADVPFFATLAQEPRVTRYVGDGHPWTPEQIDQRTRTALRQDVISQTGATRWFIADEVGLPVGLFTMSRRAHSVEIGYWVAPERWGRGVAGAMLDLGTAKVADVFGEQCVSARVAEANIASARVLTRRGFEHNGQHDGLNVYTRCQARHYVQPGRPRSR
jgi:ribosomal-protein-alanine N-acetyltransferase